VRQQWWHRARARKLLAEPGLLLRVLPLQLVLLLVLVLLKRRWLLLLHAARCLRAACFKGCSLAFCRGGGTHPSCVSLHDFITKIVEQKTRFSKVMGETVRVPEVQAPRLYSHTTTTSAKGYENMEIEHVCRTHQAVYSVPVTSHTCQFCGDGGLDHMSNLKAPLKISA